MKCYFFSISSLSFFPVFKYILNCFLLNKNNKSDTCYLIESHIKGFPDYSNKINTHFYCQFNSISEFNNMSILIKIKRYFWTVFFLFKAIISKNTIIYTSDYQVLFIAFKLFKLLGKSNVKLIYHQYELLESEHKRNILQKIKSNKSFIDFVIFPEINRLNYFINHTDFPSKNSFVFPNTCCVNKEKPIRNSILNQFKIDDIIIAHIGNVGFNHFFNEFIHSFNSAKLPQNYKLIFIGKQSDELKKYTRSNLFNNIYFFDEIPHKELSSIYSYIDYGLILYKPIDLNFDYCAPNKLYEYWAHGVPVLAHNLKGLTDIVSNNLGYLKDFNNLSTDIFTNIKKLTEERRSLIKEEFSHKFDVIKYQNQLECRIKELLA